MRGLMILWRLSQLLMLGVVKGNDRFLLKRPVQLILLD
jgi:hypothetical protein